MQRRRIVMPGRLTWDNGCLEFVQAANYLSTQCYEFIFLSPAPIRLNAAYVQQELLSKWMHCRLIRWVPYSRKLLLENLHYSDLLVFPYRKLSGAPGLLKLALKLAIPLVATKVVGCEHLITHGDNGLLVARDDSKALACAIEQFCGKTVPSVTEIDLKCAEHMRLTIGSQPWRRVS